MQFKARTLAHNCDVYEMSLNSRNSTWENLSTLYSSNLSRDQGPNPDRDDGKKVVFWLFLKCSFNVNCPVPKREEEEREEEEIALTC